MLENYVNPAAHTFFERLPSDAEREWSWMVIEEIRSRFPLADHWTTGGVDKQYIDLRFGIKSPKKKKGRPTLYLSCWQDTLYCSLHRDFKDEEGLRIATTPERSPSKAALKRWFADVQRRVQEAGIQFDGNGLNPADFPIEEAGEEAFMAEQTSVPENEHGTKPLNQILYGPPGTGKTYATIDETLRILAPAFLAAHRNDRQALKSEFDRRLEVGDVRFVTFHQSFSYEDFVEGLRADTDADGKLRYEVVDGVFKRMCDAASTQVTQQAAAPIDLAGRNIWKMSLGNTLGEDAYIYDECIENGYALLGYGDQVDFSGCKSKQDVKERFAAAGYELPADAYAITAVSTFLLKISKGDLVVVTDGNYKFRAVGEFIGDYQHLDREDSDEGYGQCRKVRWLRVYKPSMPHDALMNNAFSQTTIYQLHKHAIDHDKLTRLLSDRDRSEGDLPADGTLDAKVLIIDEINRGNVSRIFGELITLIEASKRAGQPEALTVTLPYSKESFSVPDNLYLIGTMNTADRSLAGLDIALRRRFSFKEMSPRPDLLDGLIIEDTQIDVGRMLRVMNQRIAVLLNRDHCLGHAYFMPLLEAGKNKLEKLAGIFHQNIIPLLQEYFFEDWERIRWVLNDHEKETKRPECCFIVKDKSLELQRLFGSAKVGNSRDVWRLNPSAFDLAGSYAGIGQAEPADDEAAA